DSSRIYYVGPSAGGQLGAILLAIDPSIRAGVLTSPATSSLELGRLAPNRGGFGAVLQSPVPSLINSPGITTLDRVSVPAPSFNENMPLRDGASFSIVLQDGTTQVIRSPVVNTVAGAAEIQQVIENSDWASQSASTIAYAPYIRRSPLDGVPAKSVIIQ